MTLLLVHAGATLAMVGLIWTIQIVHYPLLDGVGRDEFPRYHARHTRAITWIVGPAMLTEISAAALIAFAPPAGVAPVLAWIGLALAMLVWIVTALFSIPAHATLEKGFDVEAHRRLVRSNWIRTLLWSTRGGIALWMIALHCGH